MPKPVNPLRELPPGLRDCLPIMSLDARATALLLQVSIPTLERWRRDGVGPKFVKMGRSVRYVLKDLQSFQEESSFSRTSDALRAEARVSMSHSQI